MLLTRDEKAKFIADKVKKTLEKSDGRYLQNRPYDARYAYEDIFNAISQALNEIEKEERRILSGDEAGV